MSFSDVPIGLIAELHKRRPTDEHVVAKREEAAATAARLRAFMYPKQLAYYTSKAKRKATNKTRRAGATAGGVRELLARGLELPGFRATYVTTTRIEARARAWENDTHSGLVDVLKQYGVLFPGAGVEKYVLGGVVVEVRQQDLALEFSNGSKIDLFGANEETTIGKLRGLAKHVIWPDEAQDFRWLEKFYKAVVVGALADYDGECWVSGTPGVDCSGMFYEITRDDGEGLPGWEVHTIAVVDNPYFGAVVSDDTGIHVVDNMGERTGPYEDMAAAEKAAKDIRWERTAGKAKRENGWADDDPDLEREWYARWSKKDARYVYPVHVVEPHKLTYAPMRVDPSGWLDFGLASNDLPRKPRGKQYQWLYAIGADFGYHPDNFALCVWAFTFERPDVYEIFSWKQTKVLPDDQRDLIHRLWKQIDNIAVLVGDGAGGKAADFEAWKTRINLPMEPARKAGRMAQEELLAGDIRKGLVHFRVSSPLLWEMRHLVYLPVKKPGAQREVHKYRRIADGSIPSDDTCDAARYGFAHLRHHLYQEPQKPKGTKLEHEEAEYEGAVDEIEAHRKAAGVPDEDSDGWTSTSGGYEYE